jgi:glycosyltransferase involved in cell wall biosynthesis
LLVAPGDIEDLKNKLEFILTHENLRRKMALAARKLAEEKYNQNKIKQNLEKLFSNNIS